MAGRYVSRAKTSKKKKHRPKTTNGCGLLVHQFVINKFGLIYFWGHPSNPVVVHMDGCDMKFFFIVSPQRPMWDFIRNIPVKIRTVIT
jgi:hypothetical protein